MREVLGGLKDQYVLFNLDENESMNTPFQISRIEIDKSEKKAKVIYQDRKDPANEIVQWGNIEIHGFSSLLFRFKSRNFFLEVLAYIPPQQNPEVIQAIYLHADQNGHPRSALGLLVDPDKNIDTRGPSRDEKDVPGLVAEYLTYEPNKVLKFHKKISDFKDLKINRGETYDNLASYEGNWHIFYHERYANVESLRNNPYISSIGKSTLVVKRDKMSGEYLCTLTTPDDYEFEGRIKYRKLISNSYLIFALYKKGDESKYVSFVFHKGNHSPVKKRLYGVYNITYFNESSVGCGIAIMEQANAESKFEPVSINPLEDLSMAGHLKVIKYLSFRQNANIEISRFSHQEVNDQPFRYHGIYRVYSYGRKRATKQKSIIIGALRIYKSGYVEYRGPHPDASAFGVAFKVVENNLHIELRNKASSRQGYYLLHTIEVKPEAGRIYCGILAGLGFTNQMPLGKRVIFEYLPDVETIEEVNCKKINLFSEEIKQIPDTIRETLTGRIENFISFTRSNAGTINIEDLEKETKNRSINLQRVFLESALYKAQRAENGNDVAEVVRRLRKAVEHGYTDIPRFLKEIEDLNPKFLPHLTEHEDYHNLRNWLQV